MAFAVGRVLSWSGFWGFLGLFSIFVVKRWLVGVMVRGGHAGEEKSGVWHDKYGYRHPGKGKQTKFRRFPPPPKRKIKNITFPIDKVGKRGYSNVINKNNKQIIKINEEETEDIIMAETNKREYKFETLQLHVGQESPDPVTDARAVPIYQTSSYVFRNCEHAAARFGLSDAGNIYGRLTNPTEDVFEQRIAALEGGVAALAVASGAAAISYTIQNLAHNGDHIVAAKNIYGGTYNLLAHTLPEYGITATFVDPENFDEIRGAIQENTKAVFIETLGNPNSDVVDIEAIAKIAHENKIPLVIDNTFATPYLVRPIEYGADIVVHSATKFIGGHGTTIGGVIVDSGKFDWEASGKFESLTAPNPSYHGISFTKAVGPAAFVTKIRAILLRDTGATISPFHAFIFLQGLETLSLRVERHVENALKVVNYLENHPLVEKVNHPSVSNDPKQQELYKKYFPNGGGSIFTFEIKGSDEEAKKFIDHLQLFSLLANVADVKSLVIHPASTTHSQLNEEELADQGIKPNTIRLSIGTENVEDIIYDLEEAFKALA